METLVAQENSTQMLAAPSSPSQGISDASGKRFPQPAAERAKAEARDTGRMGLISNARLFGLLLQILGGVVLVAGVGRAFWLFSQHSVSYRVEPYDAFVILISAVLSAALIVAFGYILKLLAAIAESRA